MISDEEKKRIFEQHANWDKAKEAAVKNDDAPCPECKIGQIQMIGQHYYRCNSCGASLIETVKLDMRRIHHDAETKKRSV